MTACRSQLPSILKRLGLLARSLVFKSRMHPPSLVITLQRLFSKNERHMNLFRRTLTMNSCQHQCDKPQLHCWLLFSMFSTLHSVFFRLIVSPASFTPPSKHCPGRHYLTCMLHIPNLILSLPPCLFFVYIFFSRVKQETDFSQSVESSMQYLFFWSWSYLFFPVLDS